MALGMPSARQLSRPGEYARAIAVAACQGRSIPAQKVSLFELCCGRCSRLSLAAAREGHAAIRITRPRRWRPKRRSRNVSRGRGEYERALAAALPTMRRRRVASFSVDVCKPHHRVRLLALLRMARPAPGTSACHLHVSFPCNAFCSIHALRDPKGKRAGYRAAVLRLWYERSVLRSFCAGSADGTFRVSRSYEKSGSSRMRPAGGWPWGIRGAAVCRVASCMCGLRIGSPSLPSAHVWQVQSDHFPLLRILRMMVCSRDHSHARCVKDSKRLRASSGERLVYGSITATENYTLVMGYLMVLGIAARR